MCESDVRMLVEDTQRGNEWSKKAWPGEDHSEDLQNIDVPVRIVVGALDIVGSPERVQTEVLEKVNIDNEETWKWKYGCC